AVYCHRAIIVVADDHLRPSHDLDAGQRPQGHHLACIVANVDPPDVRNIGAVERFALNVDLPGAAEQVEVVDEDAAECRLQGGKDVVDGDAERLCLAAVDVEIQGRIGCREGRKYARKPWIGVGGTDQRSCDAGDLGRALSLQRLQLVLESTAGGEADDRRQGGRQQ